jgi:outer membrane protein OmpA-like peptidoglycan-associated protein
MTASPLRSSASSTVRFAGPVACLAALLCGSVASAQEFSMHVEPAVAFWADKPQSSRFSPGFALALRPSVALGPVVGLQLSYAVLAAPPREGYPDDGTAQSLLAGVRVRPLGAIQDPEENLGGLFADFDMGYVRTGPLDRFGFDVGIGYGFQMTGGSSIGPVLRYMHVVQPDDLLRENPADAQLLMLGVDFALGMAHKPDPVAPLPPGCPDPEKCVQEFTREMAAAERLAEAAKGCPDRDRDGVCDGDDRCPKQMGVPATFGCPMDPCSGAPLRVLVQFPFDSAALPPPSEDAMDPVLDAVAAAIARDPSCRVCAMGHASEEGPKGHNQTLSEERAAAVQGYLTARGVTKARIPTTGMGERCQIVPMSSLVMNRRVDFLRLAEGESCPSVCPE